MEFYNSSKYNPDYRYSFIYPNPVQPRILCPKCGNNTYKGYTNDLEWGADPKPCPDDPNLISVRIIITMLGRHARHADTHPLKLSRGFDC